MIYVSFNITIITAALKQAAASSIIHPITSMTAQRAGKQETAATGLSK